MVTGVQTCALPISLLYIQKFINSKIYMDKILYLTILVALGVFCIYKMFRPPQGQRYRLKSIDFTPFRGKITPTHELSNHIYTAIGKRRFLLPKVPAEKLVLGKMVEAGGVEPPSKQRTGQLSTCLAFLWFSTPACRRAGQRELIL